MRYLLFFLIFLPLMSTGQTFITDKAFQVFDSSGTAVSADDMLKKALKADVVFFGELHNNPIAHWLQLELTQALFKANDGKLMLGAEMFEADNQILINEYFLDLIPQKNFEDEARLWNNYKTDYKPLLEFAKANTIPFVATNIPRRYANLVFRGGFEAINELSDQAQRYIAPTPIPYDPELPGYKGMLEMMGGHGGEGAENFPKAQAVKDATMGYFITKNYIEDTIFLHYNGSYHSQNKEGIVWYINHYAPELKVMTITTVETEDISEITEEQQGLADYIITIPSNMTKTY